MSAPKQDLLLSGGLRVAANDPHFVSLGGGRLSTAVTIHYIPVGSATIGSSSKCNIHINGIGVQALHCTVRRSKEGEVTITPENGALIFIDGQPISKEMNLLQGAMLTIGNSNYLRFNNPSEAELIKSSLESANFATSSPMESENSTLNSSNQVFESQAFEKQNNEVVFGKITELGYTNFNNFHSPKVFTSNSVTVNAPAKDVLGPKYANFAKNLVENNIICKTSYSKNNGINAMTNNVPPSYIQKSPFHDEILIKVHNSNNNVGSPTKTEFINHEKYSDSSLRFDMLSMNDLNSDVNCFSDIYVKSPLNNSKNSEVSQSSQSDELNEILKICSEYERQNQSLQSSPIVQNRIKTNGSLPKEKKPSFDVSLQASYFPKQNSSCSFIHENLNMASCKRDVKICDVDKKSDNHSVRKFLPQSPRTKIRTICTSPKKELINPFLHNSDASECSSLVKPTKGNLKSGMKSTKCARSIESAVENDLGKNKSNNCSLRCSCKDQNVNELIALNKSYPTTNSPIYEKSDNSYLAGESQICLTLNEHLEKLKSDREGILSNIRSLKAQISDIQRQEEEILHEFDMEKALVSAEMSTMSRTLIEMEKQFSLLKTKIFRLEAQRNADRVMQETQQAKLKQSIELKHEHIASLEKQLQEESDLDVLQLELIREMESLESDRKFFEDLEFQYLEEEADWMAYKEELYRDLKRLFNHIEGKRSVLFHLYDQKFVVQNTAFKDTKTLENNLLILLTMLEKNREILLGIERNICEISGQEDLCQTESEEEDFPFHNIKKYDQETTEFMDRNKSFPLIHSIEDMPSNLLIENLNENIFVKTLGLSQKQICDQRVKPNNVPNKNGNIIDNFHNNTNFVRKQDNTFNIYQENTLGKEQLQHNIQIESDNENLVYTTNMNNCLPKELYENNEDQFKNQLNNSLKGSISTEGANSKIVNSIKKIELNRQLLLSQQGHHRIKYERQNAVDIENKNQSESENDQTFVDTMDSKDIQKNMENFNRSPSLSDYSKHNVQSSQNQQRLSHPELESQKSKPLTEENLKLSLKKQYKSTIELSPEPSQVFHNNEEDKRASLESQSTTEENCSINNNLPRHQRPLTRYLPNMSPDLDLKIHIESAGHQISLCPYVQIDSYSCRGYLHKLRATFHGWSKRWFVFDRIKSAFIYFCDKTEKKIRGGVYFSAIEEVYLDHLNASKSGRPNCTFVIKTKKRSFHLMAASDVAARIWIDAIITGAQGKVNY